MRSDRNMETLSVSELFVSIQGESLAAGRLCAFVRLAGCNLRCAYCDTDYAWDAAAGRAMDVDEVAAWVSRSGVPLVEITGGEPLLQPRVYALMETLIGYGLEVLLETNGHVDAREVPEGVTRIIDVKTPGSGMADGDFLVNLPSLRANDQIKFVLTGRKDYDWAKRVLGVHPELARVAAILFSPAFGALPPRDLAEWIIADRLPVRFQLQLHKYVWGPQARGV
ncbi:MAG TPA: radical SAM protein [Candidatus Latescibacteria bacterium]|nr:radical SAM protein [Candidatus Latescibacterota bacterium]